MIKQKKDIYFLLTCIATVAFSSTYEKVSIANNKFRKKHYIPKISGQNFEKYSITSYPRHHVFIGTISVPPYFSLAWSDVIDNFVKNELDSIFLHRANIIVKSSRQVLNDVGATHKKVVYLSHFKENSKLLEGTSTNLLQIPCSLLLKTTAHGDSIQTRDFSDEILSDATPLVAFLDTGAQVTILSFNAAKNAGLAHLIDTSYSGYAIGVGGISCRILGRIPANTISILFQMGQEDQNEWVVIENSPAITILEDLSAGKGDGTDMDLLLGLDVLEDWQATICLSDRTLTIRNFSQFRDNMTSKEHENGIVIPFINRREESATSTDMKEDFCLENYSKSILKNHKEFGLHIHPQVDGNKSSTTNFIDVDDKEDNRDGSDDDSCNYNLSGI